MGLSSKHVSNNGQDWSHGLLHSPSEDSGSGSTLELPNPPMKRRQEEEQNLLPPTEKLKCPRCDSMNTKFCYYNNYNKSQPRHFCKACKRHWTNGGMLRNVPIGGGRKNKRLKTTTASRAKAIKNSHAQMEIIGQQLLAQESLFNSSKVSEFNYNSTIFGGSSRLSIPQNHDLQLQLQFPCSSFITVDSNFPCSVPSNPYATNGTDHSLNDKPWPTEESPIYWGWDWDEIDKFVTADITLPWDDEEII